MSSLEKLMIRGIRSYNPNTSNTIYFSSPLTLIVGQNGTGKTTIIEALKFITTNDLPQNSRGGAFIYHPKLLHQVDVKAQVKLKFRNIENVEMVCTRSLQATNKKSGLTQKSIESTLLYKNSNVSISNKCVNIENEIQHHLGVSSAILQNVIFCHQEESNWILSEPGNVKKRLDDIFATSKYSKALDCIKTLKKETSGSLKSKMQELDYLNEKKVKKEKLEAQIMEYNEKSSFILKQIEECEDLQLDEKIGLLKQELKNNEENEKERMKIEIEIENLLKCKYEIINEFSNDELNEKLQIYKKNKNNSFTLLNDMTNKENFSDFSINLQQDKIKNNDLSDSIYNDKKLSKQGFFHCFSDNIPYGEYNFGKFTTDYENKILLLQEKEKKLDNQNDLYIKNKYDLSMQKNEIKNLLSKQEINNAKIFEIENKYLKNFDIKIENETCFYLKSLENELHNLENNNNLDNFTDECKKLTEKIYSDQEKLNVCKVEEKNMNFIIFESNKTICDIEKRIINSQNFKFEDVDNLYQKEIELEENCEEKEIELNSVYKNQEKIFEVKNSKLQKLQCKQDIENSKQEILIFFEKHKKLDFDKIEELKNKINIVIENLNFESNIIDTSILDNAFSFVEKNKTEAENLCDLMKDKNSKNKFFSQNIFEEINHLKKIHEVNFLRDILILIELNDTENIKKEITNLKQSVSLADNAAILYTNFLKKGLKNNSCYICKKEFLNNEKEKYTENITNIITNLPQNVECKKNQINKLNDDLKKLDYENEKFHEVNDKIKNIQINILKLCDSNEDIKLLQCIKQYLANNHTSNEKIFDITIDKFHKYLEKIFNNDNYDIKKVF